MSLQALTYMGACRWKRRARLWALLGLVAGLALIVGAQVVALRRVDAHGTLDPALLDPILRFSPLLLPAVLVISTFSSPLRLEVAEVSWVLTAPGGARALLARALLLRPLGYATAGLLGAVIARMASGRPLHDVWKVALVGALIGLALRLVSFGAHLLVVHAHAAIALRALGIAWGGALVVALLRDVPGGKWLGLRPVLRRMLDVAVQPALHSAAWPLIAVSLLVAATALVAGRARGIEERAHAAARELAEVQEALRGTARGGHGLSAKAPRRKLATLAAPHRRAASGESALCFRGIAQLRRQLLPSLVAFGLLLDIGAPLVLLDVLPTFTWAWTIVVLAGTVAGGAGMLAVELDHYHMRLAPLRSLHALVWLAAVPAAHRAVSMELAWAPVLFAPGVTSGTWFTGVLLIPFVVALAEATGSLAVVSRRDLPARAALKATLAFVAALPVALILIAAGSLGWPTTLVAPLAAGALLASAAACVNATAHKIRKKEIA